MIISNRRSFYSFIISSVTAILFTSCGTTVKTTSVTPPRENYSTAPIPEKPASVIHHSPLTSEKENTVTLKTSKNYSSLQLSFAKQLGVSPALINNTALYSFINDWLGTRYKYGGTSKKGVDCSGFACTLYKDVFNEELARSSQTIYKSVQPVKKDSLTEGDLVFFKIRKGHISHVGVYLMNDKFVHSSLSSGVIISDLNEEYYKKYFYNGGRITDCE